MGGHTVGAKPSVRFTEKRGVRISGGMFVCKSMKMAFRTEQSVCFSAVPTRRGSTVIIMYTV